MIYSWYSKGYPPEEGSWRDWSNATMEMLLEMDAAKATAERIEREKEEEKRKRSKKSPMQI